MKRLLNYTIVLSLSLVVFGCIGKERDVDNEIKNILKGYNDVGIGSKSDFITTDTIEVINNVDGSLIRMKTNIISDNIEFEVTIFKDDLVVLPKSEL